MSHLECSLTGKRYEARKVHGLSDTGRPLLVRYDLDRMGRTFTKAEAEEPIGPDLDVLLHPRLPEPYRRKVEALQRVLEGPDRAEAMELIRTMIDRVDLAPRPDGSGLDAVLHGDLAAILAACGEASGQQKLPGAGERPGSQLSVVAGTRNRLYRTAAAHSQSERPTSDGLDVPDFAVSAGSTFL